MLTVSVQWMYLKGRSRSKRAGWLGPSRQNQVIPNDPKWWFGTGPTTNPTTLNASIAPWDDHSQLTPSLYKESQQLSPALCSFSRNLSLHTAPLFPLFLHFFCTHTHTQCLCSQKWTYRIPDSCLFLWKIFLYLLLFPLCIAFCLIFRF